MGLAYIASLLILACASGKNAFFFYRLKNALKIMHFLFLTGKKTPSNTCIFLAAKTPSACPWGETRHFPSFSSFCHIHKQQIGNSELAKILTPKFQRLVR